MFTKKINRASLSALCILATICLLSIDAVGQKGVQTTEGAPLKGVDVKLGRNPGGSPAARAIRTDKDGNANLGILPKGSWYIIIVVPESDAAAAQSDDIYLVTLKGPVGGEAKWEWSLKPQADGNVARKRASGLGDVKSQGRATQPVAQKTITFTTDGPPTPSVVATLVKSKSNITNNRTAQP